GDGAELVDGGDATALGVDGELRRVTRVDEPLLDRERPLGHVEGDVLMEAPEVVVDLRLALALGVEREADAGRPLVLEAALGVDALAAGPGVAGQGLALLADAEEQGELLPDAPGVLGVERGVGGERVERGTAELAAVLAQVDGDELATPVHQRAENARGRSQAQREGR